jgi:hypothetical protein
MRVFMVFCLLLLGGCVQQKYDWGSYDQDLYNYYKNSQDKVKFKSDLKMLLDRLERQNKKPAPGLYAELGTLCLETGDRPCALKNYQKEHDAWPESKTLMQALINNLDKRPAKEGV